MRPLPTHYPGDHRGVAGEALTDNGTRLEFVELQPDLTVAAGPASAIAAGDDWLDLAAFTLTEDATDDRRVITVASIPATVELLRGRVARWPQAAAVCGDVLRTTDRGAPARHGLLTESLAYSTLQAGGEFARWLAARGPAQVTACSDPVAAQRTGNTLWISLNRPERHNALSDETRAALLEALDVARLDPSIDELVLSGAGPSFCSGGDLAEFGSFTDPASAHLARIRHSPGLVLDEVAARLGARCRARVHGHVLGGGLELAAFCGHIEAHPGSRFGLPELSLGLIPGAGGTVSVTRRIGRWRMAYLVLAGAVLDAATALAWGLVDALA